MRTRRVLRVPSEPPSWRQLADVLWFLRVPRPSLLFFVALSLSLPRLRSCFSCPPAGSLSIAVILLAVFALLALVEIQKLTAATDTIIPNLDAIILGLTDIEKGVDAAYEATTLMPLLLTMNELSGYIEGNLTITVNAMVNSPVLTGGLLGR
uniref:Uncharacterized protein n=1 Tax=Chloropicon primus TaxID=1764295 RepID=A0A7S2WYX8_9CHLO|mmetsp:Transcript_13691/g.38567  ORF Transcript_13691/g.38567 Transcript_13691/m.38567 type:complete len:152 (+) Transcript_13691:433-888(+)